MNKKIRLNKKAVSPLIAAVLLIAFTVAIGAVVMTWGRGYVRGQIDSANEQGSIADLCTSARLDVLNTGNSYEACYMPSGITGGVNLTVMNSGMASVAGFRVLVVMTNSSTFTFESMGTITSGASKGPLYNATIGPLNVRTVIVMPYVTYNNLPYLCADNKQQIEPVKMC